MSKVMRSRLIKYGCSVAAVGVFVAVYVSAMKFEGATQADWYKILCDAFTVPGMLLILIGGMVWVSTQGALDGIVYCVRWAVLSLLPGMRAKRAERYGDYVARKQEKRVKGFAFLFFTGLAALLVAVVFLILFEQVYVPKPIV